jgi:hypothetical protein
LVLYKRLHVHWVSGNRSIIKKVFVIIQKKWNKRYSKASTVIVWGLPNTRCFYLPIFFYWSFPHFFYRAYNDANRALMSFNMQCQAIRSTFSIRKVHCWNWLSRSGFISKTVKKTKILFLPFPSASWQTCLFHQISLWDNTQIVTLFVYKNYTKVIKMYHMLFTIFLHSLYTHDISFLCFFSSEKNKK